MIRFLVRRIFAAILVMFAISVITFLLLEAIPNGNPAFRLAGRNSTPAEIHLIEIKYGFNKPLYVQYVKTMGNIFTGKAISYTQGFNVDDQIWKDLPRTLWLAFGAGIIWLGLSIVIGTLAAMRAGRYTDRILTLLSMAGVSFPPFFLGAVFLYYLSYKLGWFPLSGYTPIAQGIWPWAHHLILPWVTLSILFIGFYSRVLRSTILDTMSEDYVRTAHAKGLTNRQVLFRHILRNSLIPIISLWGLDMGQVIGGGAILTESVYNINGVGELTANSIGRLDVTPILVVVLLTAIAVVVLAAIVDVVYAFLDPRIRLS